MKYYRLFINLSLWQLKPYCTTFEVQDKKYKEYGFLCFRLIIG